MTNTQDVIREQLRAERKLRLIPVDEEGSPIDRVLAGVYGFSHSPGTEGLPLYATRTFQIFEVHKLADGQVHLVGYMSKSDANVLRTGDQPFEARLYPDPYEKASEFVSVPRSRLIHAKMPSRIEGNSVWLTLTTP
jgi:hypothetical protein